jgi:8-oxo-dGTP pyrophosphatase MutT (NUDIX family)
LENIINSDFKRRFKEALAQRTIKRIIKENRKPSAVLIPLYYSGGQHHLVFTKRTELVHYHKGEISFPGGGYHQEDGELLNTALRETSEEIGLDAGEVEVLGELDDILTKYSHYTISPFAGIIPAVYEFKPNPFETAEILQIPVPALQELSCRREEPYTLEGETHTGYKFSYQNHTITGATARILKQFLDIYSQVMQGMST